MIVPTLLIERQWAYPYRTLLYFYLNAQPSREKIRNISLNHYEGYWTT